MKVYHSSPVEVKKPDTRHSRAYLDFGPGFYVTTLKEQAEKYAGPVSAERAAQGLPPLRDNPDDAATEITFSTVAFF